MRIPARNTPRWIIFLADIGFSILSLTLAYFVRFEFQPPLIEVTLALRFAWIFILIRALSFIISRTYAGIIRYTSTQDTKRIFLTLAAGTLAFLLLNQLRYHFFDGIFFIPNSIIIIEFLLTLFAMVVSRIAVKLLFIELKGNKTAARVAIYGAGEAGLIAKRTIDQDAAAKKTVVAFLDDDGKKAGKKLEGTTIYFSGKADDIFAKEKIDELIISIQKVPKEAKHKMVAAALRHNVRVLTVPPVKSWINGELSVYQMRNIRIEDLLGREPIQLDNKNVLEYLQDKTILITGGAGSIGSELVRQIVYYRPAKVIVFDQAESPLYELQQELNRNGKGQLCEYAIGDVRQEDRVRRLFDHFKPQIVFHAAAYKHVPLMEDNPTEAVLANVKGSKVVADLSDEYGVERFVLVSTDKAVNPTNVMGATKRAAEIYVQSRSVSSKTAFITTRFGNVLGSTGSVIPLFKKQIEEGGPITLTHAEVTRFFMTIPEAVQLVLEAGAMGKGGEIFVFDMGESVKIIDLARQMIKLAGLEEGKDITIEITGLRPGEKLYEELLTNEENTLPTHHPKILKAKVRHSNPDESRKQIEELISLFNEQNNDKLVKKLKEIVPEFISNNSDFSRLDT
jgi:FlaA1/EpsC-like NDP-sugar epimerase